LHSGEYALNDVCTANVFQARCGKLVKGHKFFPVFLEFLNRPCIPIPATLEEMIKCIVRGLFSLRHLYVINQHLRSRLYALRQRVLDVRRPVHPAPLLFGCGKYLGKRFPESKRFVCNPSFNERQPEIGWTNGFMVYWHRISAARYIIAFDGRGPYMSHIAGVLRYNAAN
jgi:hypothetical protein